MELIDYLREKLSEKTVRKYLHDIGQYRIYNANHETAGHKEVMDYIGHLRRSGLKPQTVRGTLYSIKKYYEYLQRSGVRNDHPCKFIRLRDGRTEDVQLQDLFTAEELVSLLEREERYEVNKIKNQLVIGLLIYQALTVGEIVRLEVHDLDLDQGELYVKSSKKLKSRTLKLESKQILLIYKYVNEVRLKIISSQTDQLILTMRGKPEKEDGIHYLIDTMKGKFPTRRLTPTTIRQSVITNLLKSGNDLRIVQAFAGHKYTHTTEKYKQTSVEELKKGVEKYHPLG